MTTRRNAVSAAADDAPDNTADDLPTQLDLPNAGAAAEDTTAAKPPVRSQPISRPRRNTLAAAIRRPPEEPDVERVEAKSAPEAPQPRADVEIGAGDLPAGIADEVDEWSVADQPTVYLAPQPRSRPQFLETGESQTWPPRPAGATPPPSPPRPDMPRRAEPGGRPPAARSGGVPTEPRHEGASRPVAQDAIGRRYAAPEGRTLPRTPPAGAPRAGLSNPRLSRFQELRSQRAAHEAGERSEDDQRPVADLVRQWWSDLAPGLARALDHQHEARASGVHPIPAHEPTATSRLGDAFGRVAASARELTERAQAAAAPTLKRLHNQAEQAAQAIVGRIEGSSTRQQAPLLGPGRIAVFFKQGVTVGQAQRLLAASHARPIRLIPRKHGFLSLVPPGAEAEIGNRLREHPYVRDVAFLDYNEYGETVAPPE
ncbi:MAG TPA: hypothetical protein VE258_04975 [Ktedonobacterales bacterium]|nr:hypothetical protein [Ktedonobacterales bacterium]